MNGKLRFCGCVYLLPAYMHILSTTQTLKHPNIVRLYDVIETDKYIGIILEYASGGELFDHILAHRYLREKDACKLFAQLISGVWYIHQKKIVHRDLKLENLLLDRHRNVIITDFGFANRFEHRSDDLMQTSCGSPCYAAPELVISDGLYVGSAVDIWSCGVILYAMLAGYLPFDDDPANPDGDNINLLYKYIVNTPLSFPEYISEDARDLLSMMLVPDPVRRADLPSIMAHRWLAPYAHIFHKSVDDLERTAMEQHHQKRLAYQRSMKQAAVDTGANKISRSQSAQTGSGSHSRSHRAQPEYLYETSGETSMYSTSTPPTRRGYSSAIVAPTSSALVVDDDPFAPTSAVDMSSTSLLPSSPVTNGHGETKDSRDRERKDGPIIPAMAPVKNSPDAKRKGAFRHTIQVEYGEPSESQPQQERPKATEAVSPVSPRRSSSTRAKDRSEVSTPRKPVPSMEQVGTKPLPVTPSSTQKENTAPSAYEHAKAAPAEPILSIEVTSPPLTPHAAPEEKAGHVQNGTASSMGSGSTRGRHKRGLSIDKMGISKIFGSSAAEAQPQTNGSVSRSSSQQSSPGRAPSRDTITPSKDVHRRPSTLQVPLSPAATNATSSDATLLSPDVTASAKKSRRNTLTVMVEPLRASLKQRTKGRNVTPEFTSQEKTPTEKDRLAEPTTPHGVQPPEVPKKEIAPATPHFSPRADVGAVPASTLNANRVMQWFWSKSKGKPPVDLPDEEKHQVLEVSRTEAAVNGASSSKTGNKGQTPTSEKSGRSPFSAHPVRSASAHTDTPFSERGFAGVLGRVGGSSAAIAKGTIRIHHGAVDQTTITTGPPPDVMKHVKKVLEDMGVEIQIEGDYKYRCIRPKRKKAVTASSSGLRETGSGIAAFTMVGSAASNGVSLILLTERPI